MDDRLWVERDDAELARAQCLAIPTHAAASEALGLELLDAIRTTGSPIHPLRAVHRGEHLEEIERALIDASGSR